jgi:tRNA(Arg) A34 adenosine deaminase TadA
MLPEWVWSEDDRRFMAIALDEARAAADRGEVPVGAVLVRGDAVLARNGNRRQRDADPSAHAELLVLREGGRASGDWRLTGCTLYVTLEPCAMCVAACRQARLDLIIWGAADQRAGACGSVLDLASAAPLGPALVHRGGLAAEAASLLLRAFFAKRRGAV